VDEDGFPDSCNSPDMLESRNVGHVFNTRFSKGKLIAQLWLDVEKLGKVDDQLLQRLNAKEPIEVSTGLFLSVDNQSGEWNGEEYVGIARDFRPDHLALLPIGTGACSLKDGCGIRANSSPLDYRGMWQRLVAHAAPSFEQVSSLIQTKLRENNTFNKDKETYYWVEEVWPDYFVYSEERSTGKTQYYKQSYKLNENEDGTDVEFTGTPTPVKLERKYVEITKNQGGNNVDKKEKIKFLTDNGCQCDADQLETLEEAILDNMIKTVQSQLDANKELKDQLAANQVKLTELKNQVKELEKAKPADNQQTPPKTLEELLALASPEMQSVLNRAVARDRQLKTDLVEKLAANQKVYSKEELEQKSLEELEKLAALATPKGDYTLAGGRAPAPTANAEEPMVAPTLNFAK